ncbi:hypothetical protein ACILG0_11895 [Pseudomonadota bacterium AL_CKDN230030165-1A_HGKHYDSX7]
MIGVANMKLYRGKLANVRCYDNETEHYTGEGVAKFSIKSSVLGLHLEDEPRPFSLTSMEAHRLMLSRGDELEIAGVPFKDHHIVVYGVRNLTDGSTYLVLPSDAAQRGALHWVSALFISIGIFVSMIAWFKGVRDPKIYLGPVLVCGGIAGGMYLLTWLTRRSFLLNIRFAAHHQEGGHAERDAAARVLGVEKGADVVPI